MMLDRWQVRAQVLLVLMLVGAALFGLIDEATAEPIAGCALDSSGPITNGDPVSACESAWMESTNFHGFVHVCRGVDILGLGDCEGEGAQHVLWWSGDLDADDRVYSGGSPGGWKTAASVTFASGGGGSSGGGEGPEFDAEMVAEAFGAGFLLVFACWALGMGVGVVVDLVRK